MSVAGGLRTLDPLYTHTSLFPGYKILAAPLTARIVCGAVLFRSSIRSWRRDVVVVSGVRHMNEVNARLARLVLGWVTVFGRVYHIGM